MLAGETREREIRMLICAHHRAQPRVGVRGRTATGGGWRGALPHPRYSGDTSMWYRFRRV